MYNSENVKKIKLCIRLFLLALTVVPTIVLIILLMENAALQKNLKKISQNLELTQQQALEAEMQAEDVKEAAEQLKKPKETNPDFIVKPGEFYNPYGKAIVNVCPQMVIDWRMEPVNINEQPTVYLTFDDGPSAVTEQVLKTLDEYNVKATFFVLGSDDEYIHSLYRQIVRRGHTLAMHSYSHDYKNIYSSTGAFVEDMNKLFNLLNDITGETPALFRFPGGANNDRLVKADKTGELIEEMTSRGFIYHDWNASGEDAVFIQPTKEAIAKTVINTVGSKQHAVVLLHDSANKSTTADALPEIIETLQKKGYKFEKITTATKAIHFA